MRFWVGVTDYDWFQFLASLADVDEVNFWQPSALRQAVILEAGAQFLFKLHARDGGYIVGGGTFVRYSKLSPRFAWDAFGLKNGASSLSDMVRRIEKYRRSTVDPESDEIGAFVLVEPFFLPRDRWIAPPPDWAGNIVQGKTSIAISAAESGCGRQLSSLVSTPHRALSPTSGRHTARRSSWRLD